MLRRFILAAAFSVLPLTAACAQTPMTPVEAATQNIAPTPLVGEKLVVFIKTDEIRQVGMGLHLARGAAKKGAAVTVIFGADGVYYPLRDGVQESFGATGETPRTMITEIVAAGADVYVCKLCATWLEFEDADFIDGVQIVNGMAIFEKLFEDDAASLEF